MKRVVMVFGVFDGLHEGHRHVLKQAKAFGERLVVVVARDEIVEKTKGRLPKSVLEERISALKKVEEVAEVIAGDEIEGSWAVVEAHKPDVIALGYDQQGLAKALRTALEKNKWKIAFVTMAPHEPEKYKSSIVNAT